MKRSLHTMAAGFALVATLLLAACGGGGTAGDAATQAKADFPDTIGIIPPMPYSIQIDTFNNWANLVGVHSASLGQDSQGRWIIIGGRVNGFHGFSQPDEDFPYTTANKNLMVFDPAQDTLYTMPVDDLNNPTLALGLSASNAQHVQDQQYLYVCGGYAQDTSIDSTLTLSTMTQIEVDAFANGVAAGDASAVLSAIATAEDNRVQVTGGELFKLSDGYFYLVFGHSFNGTYSNFQAGNGTVKNTIQQYTDEVRRFKWSQGAAEVIPGVLNLSDYSAYQDDGWSVSAADSAAFDTVPQAQWAYFASRYHRRDLNVMPAVLDASGNTGLGAYAGVFTCPDPPLCNNSGVWNNPVYILPGSTAPAITVDENFSQAQNVYASWNMAIYDPATTTMYSTLFGGISGNTFQPFTDTVSTVARNVSTGATTQLFNQTIKSSVGFIGSEGELVLNSAPAR